MTDACAGSTSPLHVILFSFGFKFGIPEDVNLLWDVRFLPNPYWVEALRARTGQEPDVADYAVGGSVGQEFLRLVEPLLIFLVEKNIQAGKDELRLAVGCTGGKHRSVAVVEALGLILGRQSVELTVFHRDIEKE
ncbi:MAG: RNase adapter RapZ [Desulfocapsaceae bacterium]|nr:RNase adapter RapZ [Desulfocapsaceae bacterium]